MSGWDDDDLPALPPRIGAAVEFERENAGVGELNPVANVEVDLADVLGSNPVRVVGVDCQRCLG